MISSLFPRLAIDFSSASAISAEVNFDFLHFVDKRPSQVRSSVVRHATANSSLARNAVAILPAASEESPLPPLSVAYPLYLSNLCAESALQSGNKIFIRSIANVIDESLNKRNRARVTIVSKDEGRFIDHKLETAFSLSFPAVLSFHRIPSTF